MAKTFGPNARVLACTALLAAGAVATHHAQLASSGALLVSDISAPAIDRGLRNLDPPRNPRNDAPDITVEIVRNGADPGGVSELAVPPVAPAIANALQAATGVRFRRLPLLSDVE